MQFGTANSLRTAENCPIRLFGRPSHEARSPVVFLCFTGFQAGHFYENHMLVALIFKDSRGEFLVHSEVAPKGLRLACGSGLLRS